MRISETVLDLVRHDAKDENWVADIPARIQKDDPGFYLLIDQIIGADGDQASSSIGAVLIAYRMFETQLEIDKLEEQFNDTAGDLG